MEFNTPHTSRLAYILEINLVIKLCAKPIGKKITVVCLALPEQLEEVLKNYVQSH